MALNRSYFGILMARSTDLGQVLSIWVLPSTRDSCECLLHAVPLASGQLQTANIQMSESELNEARLLHPSLSLHMLPQQSHRTSTMQ